MALLQSSEIRAWSGCSSTEAARAPACVKKLRCGPIACVNAFCQLAVEARHVVDHDRLGGHVGVSGATDALLREDVQRALEPLPPPLLRRQPSGPARRAPHISTFWFH